MTGLVILFVALVAAIGFGLYRRTTDGSFASHVQPTTKPAERTGPTEPTQPTTPIIPADALGERATLVQFSSAFCAPCRTTRVVLADVAEREPGVAHVEVDAEQHLDLVRALDVRRTPTTLILDAAGVEIGRAAGAPRREQVLAALPQVTA